MKRLILSAAERPLTVIIGLLVLTLLALTQLHKLQIHISAEGMLEKGTPDWANLVSIEATFGSEDLAIVVLSDPNLFALEKIEAARELVRALSKLSYVASTSSLFDVPNLQNVDGYIHTHPYLKKPPESPEQIAQLKAAATRNPLVLGNLISANGQTMAVNLSLNRKPADTNFDRDATAAIEALIAPLRADIAQVYQVGGAAMRSDLTGKIRSDQAVLLPLSVLVLLLTLAFGLRRMTAAAIPLVTAGLSVAWTLGLMGWLGIPVNIMTSIVPALVIVIGSTEDIHLLAEYAAGIQAGQSSRAAIDRMAGNMGTAVLLTFVTTYLGFLSIALNQIELLYQFGLIASSGLLFNFAITVLLVPVMLRYFGHRKIRAEKQDALSRCFQRVGLRLLTIVLRHRRIVLGLTGLLAMFALASATQLRINNNLLDYLDPKSSLQANAERIHNELSGVHSFSIVAESGIDNTFIQVKYLDEIVKIQRFLDNMGTFDRSFSFADFITLVNSVMADDYDNSLRLPDSDDILREYMLFIKHRDIAAYVSPNFDRTRILVRHNISSSDALNKAVAAVTEFVEANIDPALRVHVTGKSVLANKAVEQMARGQLQSLLLVGAVIFVLVSLLFLSLRAGFIALIPNLVPVTMLFGVMALAEIPLNAGTSMVAAIALGICVDDTMHVMSRFHKELKQQASREVALTTMIRAEAVPIFVTSVALAAGFAVLAISSFQPVVNFGLLSAMVILVALLVSFVLTPVLLGSSELLTVWDLLFYQLTNAALQKAPLFQGMYVWQIKKILLASEIRSFPAEALIVKEGQTATDMFVVLEGRVEAQRHNDDGSIKRLRTMRVGDLFGEVGPLSSGQRTADVVALEDVQVLVLSWERLDRLTRLFPILAFRLFRNLTKIIGARLRQTSEYAVANRQRELGNGKSTTPSIDPS